MTFALLVFGRSRTDMSKVMDGTREILVATSEVAEAKAAMEKDLLEARARELEAAASARREWVRKADLRTNVEESIKTGTFRSEIRRHDEFQLNGVTERVSAGLGRRRLEELALKEFPEPGWKHVSVTAAESIRTWRATMFWPENREPIPTPENLDWEYGIPSSWIASELSRLELDGWTVLHTSEDHGLYKGEDAVDESFATRVKFLLHRPDLGVGH